MTGSRTVGYCAHIAMLIYYLSYRKYVIYLQTLGYTLNNCLISRNCNQVNNDNQPTLAFSLNDLVLFHFHYVSKYFNIWENIRFYPSF